MRTAILALALLLPPTSPLSSQDTPPTKQEQGENFTLSFGWPQEGQVHVRYTNQANGQTIGLEYDARWKEVEGEIHVRFANLNVASVDKLKRGDPDFKQTARQIGSMFRIAPAMRITPQGEWVGTKGHIDTANTLKKALQNAKPGNKQRIQESLSLLKDPVVRETLVTELTEQWNWWAGFWVGYEASVGKEAKTEVEIAGRAGTIHAAMSVKCLGTVTREGMECARMKIATAYDPADMLREIRHTLRESAPDGDVSKSKLKSVKRFDRIEGLYSIDTLKPIVVRWERETAVDAGNGPLARTEAKTWLFEWPEATAGGEEEGR